MPRFTGYGYKVVGMANGVVSVAPRGFGEDWSTVPGSSSSEGSFGPVATPLVAQINPSSIEAIKSAIKFGPKPLQPLVANLNLPGSAGPESTTPPPVLYECPDGARVMDPSLCSDTEGMKKYLLPAAILVGAIVLSKLM